MGSGCNGGLLGKGVRKAPDRASKDNRMTRKKIGRCLLRGGDGRKAGLAVGESALANVGVACIHAHLVPSGPQSKVQKVLKPA